MLDIGGWADPFERADWVLDLEAFDTRGLYARAGWRNETSSPSERFTRETWVQRDICNREPFPFSENEFDFVVCTHTLEDVRDPVWVCSEINRIGKAGYIEVPSRLEEQSWGVVGPFVGRHHHRWLIDADESGLEFVFKPHGIHSARDEQFHTEFFNGLTADERNLRFWWEDSFTCRERILFFDIHEYLAGFVSRELGKRNMRAPRESPLRRLGKRLLRRR